VRTPHLISRRIATAVLTPVLAAALLAGAPAAFAGAAAPGAGSGTLDPADPYFPQLGNGGYDVVHYDLGITFLPPSRVLDGDTRIQATATAALRSFHLDLTGLTVKRVDVDGKRARFTRDGGELIIRPRVALAKGARFLVRVRYSGTPATGTIPGLGAPDGWIATNNGATTLNEPDGASRWFPSNDHPSDKATFTFRITAPDPLIGVANGTLTARQHHAGTTTWVWGETAPMATYLSQVAVGSYTLVEGGSVDGVALRSAYEPAIRAKAEAAAAATPEMLRYMTGIVGPFPFDTYGVLVPDSGPEGLAFEAQTMSLFSPDIFDSERTASIVLIHELSHQWFGDWVSPATWRETWLNEGFATYFEWVWGEYHFDVPAATQASRAEEIVARDQQTPTDDSGRDHMFAAAPYQRGALTIYALHQEVGDATFTKILRTYLARFGGRVATTTDFIKVASDVAGRDLTAQFRTWLGPGPFPSLDGR
jgi:aminopeptidase N